MSHCISVYLINKSELRDGKINSIINGEVSNINWVELDSGILATTHIPNIRQFGKDKMIARISTDYFGGSGSQSAKVFVNNSKVLDEDSEFDYKLRPINSALNLLGIRRTKTHDEFDVVGLGNFRSNEDFSK